MVKLPAVLALVACAAGCDYITSGFETNGFSGDPYPIVVDTDSGAIIVGLTASGNTTMRTAVLDVLSPITLIDRGPDVEPQFTTRTLTLYGASAPGAPLDVPRARIESKRTALLHPCSLDLDTCEIGSPEVPRPFDALVGLDSFGGDALRLRLATQEMFIFPDIAGDNTDRSRACDAVLPQPFRGGGTLIVGGAEVAFTNWRIAIDTCLAPNPDPAIPQRDRGIDALLVLSTAIGTSLLNESTYARYREVYPLEPELEALPEGSVLLPDGPVTGRLTSLPSIALVGNLSSEARAPCRQVYASHVLEGGSCNPDPGFDCPCSDGNLFCAAPAIIELAPPARIPVLIVSNLDPTLQALRTELRPDRPEVDGLLGTAALSALELDIDYPHDRVLGRCVDTTACGARVTLADDEARPYLISCLGTERGPFP